MKKSLVSIAVVVAAAVAGAASAYLTTKVSEGDYRELSELSDRSYSEPKREAFESAGAHFTSYNQSSYPDLTYAAENAVKAVVGIDVIQQIEMKGRSSSSYDPFLEFFGIPRQQQRGGGDEQPRYREQRGGGSGVIISDDGYIITNNHVIDGASKLKVKLYEGGLYDAEIIGADPTTDIALIKIDAGKTKLPALALGSSDNMRLGEWVLAIGSPFDLQSTITAGIVSAKARRLDVIPSEFRIESFIQTDAAVNPGNSGGALVNSKGELVGINTLIKSQTGSYVGYSFAVPESIVRKVATDLKEFGVVQRAMLGISYTTITDEFLEERGADLDIKESGGAYVASVQDGGAASEAGIREGDIIVEIDGVTLGAKVNLQEIIGKHRPGDKVKIVVKRGSSLKHFAVILRNKAGKAEAVTREYSDAVAELNGRFVDASTALCKKLEINGGVQVKEAKEGGLLARAGVREDFVITHINDREILTVADLSRVSDKIRSIDGVYPNGKGASYHFVQ